MLKKNSFKQKILVKYNMVACCLFFPTLSQQPVENVNIHLKLAKYINWEFIMELKDTHLIIIVSPESPSQSVLQRFVDNASVGKVIIDTPC